MAYKNGGYNPAINSMKTIKKKKKKTKPTKIFSIFFCFAYLPITSNVKFKPKIAQSTQFVVSVKNYVHKQTNLFLMAFKFAYYLFW